MKLFYVECKGMTTNPTGAPHGLAYVLADNPTEAYEKLKARLDKEGMGFTHERVLNKVSLLAEDGVYPACRMQLIH
jgi:hypothetical protein